MMTSITSSKLQANGEGNNMRPSFIGEATPADNSSPSNTRRCPRHHRYRHIKETPEMKRSANRITAVGAISGAAVGAVLIGGAFGILLGGVTAGLVTRGAIKSNRIDRRESAKLY